ncbi:MvaI/BcnI family restriction endonuclease [Dickeya poaceiphila]|nr:MvaI/BcnI family restriction endonuclease [Dickeya poaceiphila]
MFSGIEHLSGLMKNLGATRIIIKPLANNDNSKQQIYFGKDFSVIKSLPLWNVVSSGISEKGAIFKAKIDWFWLSFDGTTEQAKGAQIILYPDYPEVRLSGILQGCSTAPSHLMRPPTGEERQKRINSNRYLVMGIGKGRVLSYVSAWDDELSCELKHLIENKFLRSVFSVFYEFYYLLQDSRQLLIQRIKEIYNIGYVRSQRMNHLGLKIPYKAQNGAGLTLESLFNIIPNGRSEPDFMDWELKAHSGSVVTLMTPEPDSGLYLSDIYGFMNDHGSSKKPERIDFTGMHKISEYNQKTGLTLWIDGYDVCEGKIIDPDGGIFLKDINGIIAAGWSFSKIIDHWRRKHNKTCFVSYSKLSGDYPEYHFGPNITLAEGNNIKKFISAFFTNKIYYDPGVNIKYTNEEWKAKKRNQFRMKWKDVGNVYDNIENINVSEL